MRVELDGSSFDIHEVRGEVIYFRYWPPGIKHMGIFEGLCRMSMTEWKKLLHDAAHTVVN